jgi:hypothetical protein
MPTIELNDNECQQVLAILSDAPWRVANPLLMKIGEQLRVQHLQQVPVAGQTRSDGKEVDHGQ